MSSSPSSPSEITSTEVTDKDQTPTTATGSSSNDADAYQPEDRITELEERIGAFEAEYLKTKRETIDGFTTFDANDKSLSRAHNDLADTIIKLAEDHEKEVAHLQGQINTLAQLLTRSMEALTKHLQPESPAGQPGAQKATTSKDHSSKKCHRKKGK